MVNWKFATFISLVSWCEMLNAFLCAVSQKQWPKLLKSLKRMKSLSLPLRTNKLPTVLDDLQHYLTPQYDEQIQELRAWLDSFQRDDKQWNIFSISVFCLFVFCVHILMLFWNSPSTPRWFVLHNQLACMFAMSASIQAAGFHLQVNLIFTLGVLT